MTTIKNPAATRTALTLFKVMAIVAGVAMFILIFEMVMKYAFGNDVLPWWSPVHGWLFFLFVLATANLGFKVGWKLERMVGLMLLSCIPVYAFVIERRVAREVEPRLAGSLPS